MISSSARSAKPITVLIFKFNAKSRTSTVNMSLNIFAKFSRFLKSNSIIDLELGRTKVWSKRILTVDVADTLEWLSVQTRARVLNLLY